MMNALQATGIPDSVIDEALDWLIEFDAGHVSPEDNARFIRWLNQSPAHREAFESLRGTWQKIDVVQRLRTDKVDTDVVGRWSRRRHMRRRILPLSMAAAVLCAAIALGFLQAPPVYDAEYFTSIGEQQVIALPDDSRITLNTATQLEVRYTPGERRIRLLQGEALFEVAPAPSRPFTVAVGDGVLRAVGTAFTVKLQADEVEVTVTEGTVEVLPPGGPPDMKPMPAAPDRVHTPSRRVTERQRLRYRNDGVEMMSAVTTEQIKRELAWRDGMLDFESAPLSEVIAEAGRYIRDDLVIVDPALESMEFTGYFRAGDVELLMRLLESNRTIDVRREDGGIVYIGKSASR